MRKYAPALGTPLGVPRALQGAERDFRLSDPPAPPPGPDPVMTSFEGPTGYLETALVLAVTGASAWLGLRTATREKRDPVLKWAGYVGGVGSALLGLLYVGAKSGLGTQIGLPAVRVGPV